ncbi:MFS transporter [Gammaproteobacteria bacterium]|uniref:MFS transporter n=1 Tax=OM182 bacterium MED-G28 TaxID=1986256 RepID=A0A2A5WB92_9GAMM|nr:MFS transporter [Gammaproteobacteria bacterium]PDH33426.1 MAG: MFS transporter [OM182 bacterium MED-G28]
MSTKETGQIYYGWKIVAAIFVLLTFTSGLSFYNHAIYLNALATQPAFDVRTASMAVSIFFLTGGVVGLFVAKWVQDYDPRICISAGAIISFLSLTALAHVSAVWQLFVVYGFFGAGFSASSLIPATTLVTRWFRRKRAMALSVASTGLSLGGVVLTPLSILMVESLGFETAAPWIGSMFLVGVIPVAWIYLRESPESMGLHIDGITPEIEDEIVVAGTSSTEEDGVSFKEARSRRFFWGVSLAYIFLMAAQVGGIAHQYGLAREQLSEAETAIAVAILPIFSIIGRLIGGWIVDQMSIRKFAISMMVMQALSLSVLSSGYSVFTLCLGLAAFGATVGNLLMLQPLLIAEAFGLKDYARIFSVSNLMSSWGTAMGPAALGFAFVASDNLYQLPYSFAAGAGIIGLALFLFGGKLFQSHS